MSEIRAIFMANININTSARLPKYNVQVLNL